MLIPLYKRRAIVAHAVIDDEDSPRVQNYRWGLGTNGYALRHEESLGHSVAIYLHREILGVSGVRGVEVDHVNHDRLDNSRANLRLATRRLNAQNRSSDRRRPGLRGAHFDTGEGKWRAVVWLDRKRHHLGWFRTAEEAATVAAEGRRRLMPFSNEAQGLVTP